VLGRRAAQHGEGREQAGHRAQQPPPTCPPRSTDRPAAVPARRQSCAQRSLRSAPAGPGSARRTRAHAIFNIVRRCAGSPARRAPTSDPVL
jgi:hypothetical protein